ncbi:heat shock 70 kDa protein 12B-like [Mytilus edulis]|uniref:heat shock 70 kDa protein 12B-like n=1 Tax=Mytilus edulis TaxID=6550 RepID=UPI0039EF5F6B
MSTLSDDYWFVVAIDFGTTYSGYAFSSRDDFKKEPLKIISNQAWNAGSQRHFSLKTPTCLLLDDNEELVSFGYEAENRYTDIVMDREQNKYLFFQRFKMQLYKNQKIKGEMIMEDVTGKSVTAMKVFALSIKALMQHLFGIFDQRGIEIEKKEIRWVLTVPAIWSDAAKQFMRKSAETAGIKDNQLLIALEPEAASIYCQYLPIKKLQGAEKGFSMTEDGTNYMVVDNGGGTADITVHAKICQGQLREVCRASGGDCGGTSVDKSFYEIFVKLLGDANLSALKRADPSAHLDIFRELEAVKRTIDEKTQGKVTMSFPRAALDDICKTHLGKDFAGVIETTPYKDRIVIRYDKMRVDTDLITDLFKQAADKIIQLIANALAGVKSSDVSVLLLVGGFSECKIVQEIIKARFPEKRVIVPEDAGLAVLKGAVLFGHKPEYIASRIVRYTYGIRVNDLFDREVHELARRTIIDGKEKCKNIFKLYVKVGSVVELGSQITGGHKTTKAFQKNVKFTVFQSTSECPKYTDEEGCTELGCFTINIPDPSEEIRSLRVSLIFGLTELKVTAYDVQSETKCETVLDLI